jgi:ubiquinone/menaquinone biosynthesis C-methylase UbiE
LSDWRPYDNIARRYDDVWGRRFEVVARHIWALIPPGAGAFILDIGTGTGIVPHTLGARLHELSGVIGCDRSASMLAMARLRMPTLRLVSAEATHLPFHDATFDVATASFVLSHLPDYKAGLVEAHRILKPLGTFAMTSWTASTDPYSETWGQLLAEAVSKDRLQEAVTQVAPSEGYFESAANIETALGEAGFSCVEVHKLASEWNFSLELYLADRELSSGGRFARHALGINAWDGFIANAREELHRQFGSHFSYSRGFLIGLGRRV